MKIEVSIAEVVDKVTILALKLQKFKDPRKRGNVQKEFDRLAAEMEKAGIKPTSREFNALKKINLKLWEIEDAIRIKEARHEFDDEFIQLARSVYRNNDRRAALKKEINLKYKSDLMEEKEYVPY